MRTTTTALSVGSAALALPFTAEAQQSSIQAPLAGHLTVASQMRAEHTELAQQRLTRKAWRLARELAHARHEGFSPRSYRRRVSDDPPETIAHRIRHLRSEIQRERRKQHREAVARARARAARAKARPQTAGAGTSASPALQAIAAC